MCRCRWTSSEGGETTRHEGTEIEADRWIEKCISKGTCGSEWVANINFTPERVALLFSWSGFKRRDLHASAWGLNLSSHLNLSKDRKVAWEGSVLMSNKGVKMKVGMFHTARGFVFYRLVDLTKCKSAFHYHSRNLFALLKLFFSDPPAGLEI